MRRWRTGWKLHKIDEDVEVCYLIWINSWPDIHPAEEEDNYDNDDDKVKKNFLIIMSLEIYANL